MLPAESAKRCQRPRMGERFATDESDTFDATLRVNLIEQTLHCRLVASIERPSCAIGTTWTPNRAALNPQGGPPARSFNFGFSQKPMDTQKLASSGMHGF